MAHSPAKPVGASLSGSGAPSRWADFVDFGGAGNSPPPSTTPPRFLACRAVEVMGSSPRSMFLPPWTKAAGCERLPHLGRIAART